MRTFKPCYIYFIQQGDAGPVKIGHTNNLSQRVCYMQTGNPEKLHLRISVGPMTKLMAARTEKDFHRHFANQSVRGEWYKPTIMRRLACEGGWTFRGKADEMEITLYP